MNEPTPWNLLVRYLAGECSESEARAVRSWASATPERQELLAALEGIWAEAPARSDPADRPEGWDVEVGWARFGERMEKEMARPAATVLDLEQVRHARTRGRRAQRALRTAAGVALLAGAGAVGTRLYYEFSPAGEDELQTFSTLPGQRADLELGDGTTITLGPATRIRVPANLQMRDQREVHLIGVAYFDVATNPDRPFIVRAGETSTQVLGTEFGVRAYSDEDAIEVVVTEGRVRLSGETASPDERVTLTPGQRGTYSRAAATIATDEVEVERSLGWVEGRLSFDNVPLADVARELARWFDLEFRIADAEVGERRFTGTFETESVREIVDILIVSLEISYTRRGDVITFHPPPSSGGGGPLDTSSSL